ncbi:FAD-dependent oxidoreductase [Nonomuraea zeae]|uniref:FAD-dependent oxidoreductase n=1 Tax=Nonomuraea zeae TaxID=1642303 RepID=UPI00197F64E5|nr:FAD-dependent monooxygenase [Nonomuraea zeae]
MGLAPACGSLQHGISVRVIDKAARPATTSRANFVHARGSEVLDRLDALDGLPEESVRAMTITTYAGDRPTMRLRFGDPVLGTAAPPKVISQARVEARLHEERVPPADFPALVTRIMCPAVSHPQLMAVYWQPGGQRPFHAVEIWFRCGSGSGQYRAPLHCRLLGPFGAWHVWENPTGPLADVGESWRS